MDKGINNAGLRKYSREIEIFQGLDKEPPYHFRALHLKTNPTNYSNKKGKTIKVKLKNQKRSSKLIGNSSR